MDPIYTLEFVVYLKFKFDGGVMYVSMGFQGGASCKEPTCQCRRHEMQVGSLDWEDTLEWGLAIYSSIPDWSIPWTEEHGGPQSIGLQKAGYN